MRLKTTLLAILLSVLTLTANAAEVYKNNLTVTYVAALAERSSAPQYSNSIVIGLSDLSWIPASCSAADGVRFSSSNDAMLQVALSAMESGRLVFARVDTAIVTGGYCELTQLNVWANGSTLNI